MAAGEYREMTPEELMKKLDDLERELFTLGMKVGPQRNSGRIRELRRQAARVKTVLHEKGLRV